MPENIIRIDRHMSGPDSTGSSRRRRPRYSTRCSTPKANEIRQDRPCTSVPADGRHTARAVTGSGSPPKPSGSPAEMEGRRLGAAARCLREGIGEATTYLLPEFPAEHRRRIRTNNMIERLNREIRRRTRVVGCFPDGDSALMLVCARIRYVTANEWSSRRYLDMSRLGVTLEEAD